MALACHFGFSRCVPQENSVLPPYHKFFSNQACTVKMVAGCLPHSFLGVFVDLDSVSFYKATRTSQAAWPSG